MTAVIDRDLFVRLRAELAPRLLEAGKILGVKLDLRNGSYDLGGKTGRVTLQILSMQDVVLKDGETSLQPVDPARETYLRCAEGYGLKKEWLDTTFTDHAGRTFTIVGLNTRAHKMPVLAANQNGKRYKWLVDQIIRHKGGTPRAPLFGNVIRNAPSSAFEDEGE